MKIYQSEIDDGLRDQVLTNNTLAWDIVAESFTPEINIKSSALEKIIAENKDQIDLYYLRSILVTAGWNKNDDVFHPQELWDARDTPEDKPFNFMHDERDIIGHITGNTVVDVEGNEIASDESLPDTFNILTTAVVYTEWSDPSQRERMRKIVAEIEEGKWFVSMECLFPDFDYALAREDGQTEVVTRDEASAFLTKHLRAYGGTGEYDNYRVGRLLRNLSFSGKGLVSRPANPRSVILEGNEFFDESKAEILTISSIKESPMSDNHEKQILDLQKELAEAKAENEALRDKVTAEKQTEFQSKIDSLEETLAEQVAQIAGKDEEIKTLAGSVKSQEESLAAKDEDIKCRDEELAVMKKNEALMKRKAKLEDLGLDAEEAIATVEEFQSVDEETFDKIVAVMKKRASQEEQPEEAQEETAPVASAEVDEEKDSAEANIEVLEDAEESAEVAIAEAVGEEDSAESLRAVASEWLGSILQSVPKEDN